MEEFFQTYLPIVNSLLLLFGMGFAIYRMFRIPDEQAEKRLGINEATCDQKHRRIDEIMDELKESINGINGTFSDFRKNDFHHIEENTREMSERMAKMEGKMDSTNEILSKVLTKVIK